MRNKLIITIAFLTCTLNVVAQTLDINLSDPQRTRVLKTRGLDAPTSTVLWKTEKLFVFRASNSFSMQNGPFTIFGDIPTFQEFSVPIVAGDLLYFTYVTGNGYLYAIERATGKQLVTLQFDKNPVSRPAAKDNIVFFGSERGQVHAYDVRTRNEKWTFLDKDHSFAGIAPVLDRELLYFSSFERGLYAFVAETGEVKWLFKSSKWVYASSLGDRVMALVYPDHLVALNRDTGAKVWDLSVGRDTFAPALVGDQIILAYRSGDIRSYSAVDGSLQWKLKDAPRTGTGVAVYEGLIYYSGREHSLIGLDARTGVEKLRFKTTRRCLSPVITAPQDGSGSLAQSALLYVRCHDNKLYALKAQTLMPVWQLDNRKSIPPPVVFADGVMYSLGDDGYMFAIK